MVLGEFSEEEKEIVFSDLKLRRYLIKSIKAKVEKFEDLPELKSEEVLINLALEYFLEQVYLMANYDFIKDNVLK